MARTPLPASAACRPPAFWRDKLATLGPLARARQANDELGAAVVAIAARGDAAAMCLDKLLDHREANAQTGFIGRGLQASSANMSKTVWRCVGGTGAARRRETGDT